MSVATFIDNKEDIKMWLEKMNITNYTIHDDLTVDANCFINLSKKELTHIPIQFGVIGGGFDISYNTLTTLKGSPSKTYGPFNCHNNPLINLNYAPKAVAEFSCSGNMELKEFYNLDCTIRFGFIHCEKKIENILLELKDFYHYDFTYQGYVFLYEIKNNKENFNSFIKSIMEKSELDLTIKKAKDTNKFKL
jgi:hypothetical protein